MGKQSKAFLQGEGDAYYERNLGKSRFPDPVMEAIEKIPVPREVLEVGCGDGARLEKIAEKFGAPCWGMDPSAKAIGSKGDMVEKGRVRLFRDTATHIVGRYDLIIFAFCLYMVDREDLFDVVAKSDRALVDGGHIIIHDFFCFTPYCKVYEPMPELRSYHMDHTKLWLGHPYYSVVNQTVYGVPGELPWDGDATAVTVLQKKTEAFPLV